MRLWPRTIPLSAEARQRLIEVLVKHPCAHCGGYHPTACPRVKSMTFTADGKTPTSVEFWPWESVHWSETVWLHDLEPTEEEVAAIQSDPDEALPPGWSPLMAMLSAAAARSASDQGVLRVE